MKIVFAGPSLYGADYDAGDVVVRGPAQMGDVERAMADGATAIGLIRYAQILETERATPPGPVGRLFRMFWPFGR